MTINDYSISVLLQVWETADVLWLMIRKQALVPFIVNRWMLFDVLALIPIWQDVLHLLMATHIYCLIFADVHFEALGRLLLIWLRRLRANVVVLDHGVHSRILWLRSWWKAGGVLTAHDFANWQRIWGGVISVLMHGFLKWLRATCVVGFVHFFICDWCRRLRAISLRRAHFNVRTWLLKLLLLVLCHNYGLFYFISI